MGAGATNNGVPKEMDMYYFEATTQGHSSCDKAEAVVQLTSLHGFKASNIGGIFAQNPLRNSFATAFLQRVCKTSLGCYASASKR